MLRIVATALVVIGTVAAAGPLPIPTSCCDAAVPPIVNDTNGLFVPNVTRAMLLRLQAECATVPTVVQPSNGSLDTSMILSAYNAARAVPGSVADSLANFTNVCANATSALAAVLNATAALEATMGTKHNYSIPPAHVRAFATAVNASLCVVATDAQRIV